jgi:serine/threonine-protein kinase HipA
MAKLAGIEMTDCHLLEEGGRRHFMTRRFDRPAAGGKLHMQSLGALGHYDYNLPGANSYEQALLMISRLELPRKAITEQIRRMLFNVVVRNQDDHVKNIAFLMDKGGIWSLSPAFDITYSYNPAGDWTALHQMTINAKRERFTLEDFYECASVVRVAARTVDGILEEVCEAVSRWPEMSDEIGIPTATREQIRSNHRLWFERS